MSYTTISLSIALISVLALTVDDLKKFWIPSTFVLQATGTSKFKEDSSIELSLHLHNYGSIPAVMSSYFICSIPGYFDSVGALRLTTQDDTWVPAREGATTIVYHAEAEHVRLFSNAVHLLADPNITFDIDTMCTILAAEAQTPRKYTMSYDFFLRTGREIFTFEPRKKDPDNASKKGADE